MDQTKTRRIGESNMEVSTSDPGAVPTGISREVPSRDTEMIEVTEVTDVSTRAPAEVSEEPLQPSWDAVQSPVSLANRFSKLRLRKITPSPIRLSPTPPSDAYICADREYRTPLGTPPATHASVTPEAPPATPSPAAVPRRARRTRARSQRSIEIGSTQEEPASIDVPSVAEIDTSVKNEVKTETLSTPPRRRKARISRRSRSVSKKSEMSHQEGATEPITTKIVSSNASASASTRDYPSYPSPPSPTSLLVPSIGLTGTGYTSSPLSISRQGVRTRSVSNTIETIEAQFSALSAPTSPSSPSLATGAASIHPATPTCISPNASSVASKPDTAPPAHTASLDSAPATTSRLTTHSVPHLSTAAATTPTPVVLPASVLTQYLVPALRGILNEGNTCFLNATIQCLQALPLWRRWAQSLSTLPSDCLQAAINRTNMDKTITLAPDTNLASAPCWMSSYCHCECVLCITRYTFECLSLPRLGTEGTAGRSVPVLSIHTLLRYVYMHSKGLFVQYIQGDAQEFLMFFLHSLNQRVEAVLQSHARWLIKNSAGAVEASAALSSAPATTQKEAIGDAANKLDVTSGSNTYDPFDSHDSHAFHAFHEPSPASDAHQNHLSRNPPASSAFLPDLLSPPPTCAPGLLGSFPMPITLFRSVVRHEIQCLHDSCNHKSGSTEANECFSLSFPTNTPGSGGSTTSATTGSTASPSGTSKRRGKGRQRGRGRGRGGIASGVHRDSVSHAEDGETNKRVPTASLDSTTQTNTTISTGTATAGVAIPASPPRNKDLSIDTLLQRHFLPESLDASIGYVCPRDTSVRKPVPASNPSPALAAEDARATSSAVPTTSSDVATVNARATGAMDNAPNLQHTPHQSRKLMYIASPPTTLLLHLKRFAYTVRGISKITQKVRLQPVIDLAPYCSPLSIPTPTKASCSTVPTQLLYELTALVVHKGRSTNSGHYYSFVRIPSQPHEPALRAPTFTTDPVASTATPNTSASVDLRTNIAVPPNGNLGTTTTATSTSQPASLALHVANIPTVERLHTAQITPRFATSDSDVGSGLASVVPASNVNGNLTPVPEALHSPEKPSSNIEGKPETATTKSQGDEMLPNTAAGCVASQVPAPATEEVSKTSEKEEERIRDIFQLLHSHISHFAKVYIEDAAVLDNPMTHSVRITSLDTTSAPPSTIANPIANSPLSSTSSSALGDGVWYCMNDSSVRAVPFAEVQKQSENVYLAFYTPVHLPSVLARQQAYEAIIAQEAKESSQQAPQEAVASLTKKAVDAQKRGRRKASNPAEQREVRESPASEKRTSSSAVQQSDSATHAIPLQKCPPSPDFPLPPVVPRIVPQLPLAHQHASATLLSSQGDFSQTPTFDPPVLPPSPAQMPSCTILPLNRSDLSAGEAAFDEEKTGTLIVLHSHSLEPSGAESSNNKTKGKRDRKHTKKIRNESVVQDQWRTTGPATNSQRTGEEEACFDFVEPNSMPTHVPNPMQSSAPRLKPSFELGAQLVMEHLRSQKDFFPIPSQPLSQDFSGIPFLPSTHSIGASRTPRASRVARNARTASAPSGESGSRFAVQENMPIAVPVVSHKGRRSSRRAKFSNVTGAESGTKHGTADETEVRSASVVTVADSECETNSQLEVDMSVAAPSEKHMQNGTVLTALPILDPAHAEGMSNPAQTQDENASQNIIETPKSHTVGKKRALDMGKSSLQEDQGHRIRPRRSKANYDFPIADSTPVDDESKRVKTKRRNNKRGTRANTSNELVFVDDSQSHDLISDSDSLDSSSLAVSHGGAELCASQFSDSDSGNYSDV